MKFTFGSLPATAVDKVGQYLSVDVAMNVPASKLDRIAAAS